MRLEILDETGVRACSVANTLGREFCEIWSIRSVPVRRNETLTGQYRGSAN
jgi:hypothetical protein